MSFSSPAFIFAFMPLFFALYFLVPHWLRNGVLLAGSLAFYSIDGGRITLVLIASIAVNYVCGLWIERAKSESSARLLVVVGVVLNLLPLLYYKYWNFLLTVANDALMHASPFPMADIVLPAGISFFTFQGISYIVDIYRRETGSAPSLVDFGMYHTLFPQLVAGPIVRYREIEARVVSRPVGADDVEQGVIRFCIGLGKKIIIADAMGVVADHMFGLEANQLTTSAAWLGVLAYTLQIFFDFSGYSDMAIGLGRILGFRFPENFNQPYRSMNITEFWRRWHMTLSRWFRDYVYIPLGGNREGWARTYFNLFIVFVLCGLWHGAAYTFLVWGIYHGALLVIERLNRNTIGISLPPLVSWPVTFVLVMIGWVFFRAKSMPDALLMLKAMAGLGSASATFDLGAFITADKAVFLVIGLTLSLLPASETRLSGWLQGPGAMRPIRQLGALVLFVYSSALIAANGFNPFIYFRF